MDEKKPWYRDKDFVSETAATVSVGLLLLIVVVLTVIILAWIAQEVLT